jgi:hypothetical protein
MCPRKISVLVSLLLQPGLADKEERVEEKWDSNPVPFNKINKLEGANGPQNF